MAFMALGLATLLAGLIAGGWVGWRIARAARHPWPRKAMAWLLAGLAMAMIWFAAVLVFFGVFVLPC